MISTCENLKGVSGIYGVIHRDTGRAYVGHSRDIRARKSKHLHRARRGFSGKFYNAVRKYGEDAFDFEVLERCEASELLAREKFYIQFLDAVNNGFNMAAEPERSRFGVKASAETNAKVSAALTGKKRKPFTAEHLANMSAVGKSRMADPSLRESLSAKIKGRHFQTAESKAKISAASIGRVVSIETRARMSASLKGRLIPRHVTDACILANSKPVIAIDSRTGVDVMEFSSAAEAGRNLKCDSGTIAKVINGSGRSKTCGGYKWKHKTETK